MIRTPGRRGLLGFLCVVLPPVLLGAGLLWGETGRFGFGDLFRGLAHIFGGSPLPGMDQAVFELRLWRVLTAAGVGASLSLAGCLLQGLFRNPLASPGLLSTTSGAGLGALIGVLLVGGYGPELALEGSARLRILFVPVGAFLGASGATLIVTLASWRLPRGGLAWLLLLGLALNTAFGGLSALLQNLWLDDWEVSRAIVAWGFGTLEARSSLHALMVWTTLLLVLPFLPFLWRELDLLALGEEDALSLGMHPIRIRIQVVVLTSVLTGGAVAVAGQIGFLGLILPNLMRLALGPGHRILIPASLASGASFLMAVDLCSRTLAHGWSLPPGVFLSLVGAPFFLALLFHRRKEALPW